MVTAPPGHFWLSTGLYQHEKDMSRYHIGYKEAHSQAYLHGSRWPRGKAVVTAKKETGYPVLFLVIPPPRLGKAFWEGAELSGQFLQVSMS